MTRKRGNAADDEAPVTTVLRTEPAPTGAAPDVHRAAGAPAARADGPDLEALCALADAVRRDVTGDDVTYVVNRNINFTNVCYTGCRFCAFAQRRTDADAYTLSMQQVGDRVELQGDDDDAGCGHDGADRQRDEPEPHPVAARGQDVERAEQSDGHRQVEPRAAREAQKDRKADDAEHGVAEQPDAAVTVDTATGDLPLADDGTEGVATADGAPLDLVDAVDAETVADEQEERLSPLHDVHVAAGASFTDFAGWQMPVRYSSDLAEHHAVRTAAGLFDLSHMAEIAVVGPDAGAFLDAALASDPQAGAKNSALIAAFVSAVKKVGTQGDSRESGLAAALTALGVGASADPNVIAHNAGFVRGDADLAVVILSDEDDCSRAAARRCAFITSRGDRQPKWRASWRRPRATRRS